MKKYVILAGVNGAGKSTLYNTTLDAFKLEKINLDDVVREIGDWRDPRAVIEAGKIIVKKIDDCFAEGKSFCQETTLCGKTIFKTIKRAKDLGYNIEMHYVGLSSSELAKERVHNRVLDGGHGISDEDVERRYDESIHNFYKVVDLCDLIAVYDNTEEFRRFAIFKGGRCVRLSSRIPCWYNRIEAEIDNKVL
jgi:predicted ABC-type ATPase